MLLLLLLLLTPSISAPLGAAARSETWRPWHRGSHCSSCAAGPTAGARLARSQPPCPCCGLLQPSVSGQLGHQGCKGARGQQAPRATEGSGSGAAGSADARILAAKLVGDGRHQASRPCADSWCGGSLKAQECPEHHLAAGSSASAMTSMP